MTTRTTRKVATVAFAAMAALGLAACSPPNEKDSELKVDTATTQDPDSLLGKGQIGATEATGAPNVTDANESAQATTSALRENAETAPDGTPLFIQCEGYTDYQPVEITLNCKDRNDVAENIMWTSWTDEIAEGITTRNWRDQNRIVENSQIVLSNPDVVDGKLVFTELKVDGAIAYPQTEY